MRKEEATSLAAELLFAYGQSSPDRIVVYADYIIGQDYDVTARAIERIIRTQEFCPPVAGLLSVIRGGSISTRGPDPECPGCRGSGWEDAGPDRAGNESVKRCTGCWLERPPEDRWVPATPEQVRGHLADIRAILRDAKGPLANDLARAVSPRGRS